MRLEMQEIDEHAFQEGRFGAGGRRRARYEIDELVVPYVKRIDFGPELIGRSAAQLTDGDVRYRHDGYLIPSKR